MHTEDEFPNTKNSLTKLYRSKSWRDQRERLIASIPTQLQGHGMLLGWETDGTYYMHHCPLLNAHSDNLTSIPAAAVMLCANSEHQALHMLEGAYHNYGNGRQNFTPRVLDSRLDTEDGRSHLLRTLVERMMIQMVKDEPDHYLPWLHRVHAQFSGASPSVTAVSPVPVAEAPRPGMFGTVIQGGVTYFDGQRILPEPVPPPAEQIACIDYATGRILTRGEVEQQQKEHTCPT